MGGLLSVGHQACTRGRRSNSDACQRSGHSEILRFLSARFIGFYAGIFIMEAPVMNKLSTRLTVLIGTALILTGCAGGISREARSQVSYTGSFSSVQQNPDSHKGEIIMWGGSIIETLNKKGPTEMTVLQLELTDQGYPENRDLSQGRFLVHSTQFLDPAIYPEGTLITVVGRVEGSETRLIGEMPYQYPVITVIELKKWAPGENPSPRVHIGVGIGARF
jgi:outer membrane lipoprotein